MAFTALPTELVEKIASFLPYDCDLCAFTLVCHQTHDTVNHPCSGVWRQRFALLYDLPPDKTGYEIRIKYQLRQKVLGSDTSFRTGHSVAEHRRLKAIRDLIVESFIGKPQNPDQSPRSNNVAQLRYLVRRSNILQCVFQSPTNRRVTSLLQTMQLLFTHWSLEFAVDCPTYGFPASQQVAYSHPDAHPLFLDSCKKKVNIPFLLHISNFFKYHMTREEEATLFHHFRELEDYEKPKVWQGRLEQGTRKLNKSWKGSYAYLHDLRDVLVVRRAKIGECILVDSLDHTGEGFQTLELDFTSRTCEPWPETFEEHLHSYPPPGLVRMLNQTTLPDEKDPRMEEEGAVIGLPSPQSTPGSNPAAKLMHRPNIVKAQKPRDYLQFTGIGMNDEPFHCYGIIHAVPPQQGIPGWQRITMMKIFDESSNALSSGSATSIFGDRFSSSESQTFEHHGGNVVVDDYCWAYEGVVLPGGKLIMGRWWSPTDETEERVSVGPFIFWNVLDAI